MRLLAVTCAVLALAMASACGGGGDTDVTATPTVEPDDGAFPESSDWQDCDLFRGGPPPDPAVPTPSPIPARCATQSLETDEGVEVTEVQEWRCEHFSATAQGFPDCSGEFGRYTVIYVLDGDEPKSYRISGHFPPGLVE
ncbi:MAG TPA: hypothetical protein VMR52_12440 [Dehalococcoidia bacterium]|nr:hypothetical protein [Dehalococcoidia bacterium]